MEESPAQKLLREMDAKYGKTAPAPAPVVTPPVQQPVTAPAQQSSTISGAANALRGRAAQIDKAAGYACGGKVKAHAQGGKIIGPGTSTSDSIPGKVKETGEEILVSNDERIVSAKQEQLLERIAQLLGFETVDQMFEQMTGTPVGPTMKGGKSAAYLGMAPNTTEDDLSGGVYTSDGASLIDDFKKWQANKIANTNAKIDSAISASGQSGQMKPEQFGPTPGIGILPGQKQPGAQFMTGAEPGAAPKPIVSQEPGAKLLGRNDNGIITAESALSSSSNPMTRSGGIYGTYDGKGVNDILARENAARSGLIESMIKAQGGNGVAALPDRTNEPNEQMAASKLDPKEYLQYLAQKESRGNEVIRNDQNNVTVQRGQDLHLESDKLRAAKDPLEQRIKLAQLGEAETIAALRSRYLDPNATLEQKAAALEQMRGISGKMTEDNKPWAHVVGGGINPDTGQMNPQYLVTGRGDRVSNSVTGADAAKRQQQTYPKGHVVTDRSGAKWSYKGTGDVNDQKNWEKV